MSWQTQWQALSRRIGGFLEAVEVFADLFQMTKDEQGVSGRLDIIKNDLLPQARHVTIAVGDLCEAYKDVLPPEAAEAAQRHSSRLQGVPTTSLAGLLWAATILAAMKSELDYLLADQEAVTLALVERAFMHLQRTIIVDQDQRNRWLAGFEEKETRCEQMGATHLLWHGIWAFKVDAKGERTDLVLGCPIEGLLVERIRTSGSRLVLTEWKRVQDEHDLEEASNRAITQLMLYSQSSLAGIELRSARYAVIVSYSEYAMLPDQIINDVTIRFVNIVVNPPSPSKASSSWLSRGQAAKPESSR